MSVPSLSLVGDRTKPLASVAEFCLLIGRRGGEGASAGAGEEAPAGEGMSCPEAEGEGTEVTRAREEGASVQRLG